MDVINSEKTIEYPKPLPKIERDSNGRFIKGIAQDTNKNDTAGPKCEACENEEKILQMIVDYYNSCAESLEKNKQVFPQRATLARKLGYPQYTVTRWEQRTLEDNITPEHPELCVALKKLDDLQEEYLNIRTLGRSPIGAIFQLKVNHGKVETEKKLLGSDDKEPLTIRIVEEKPIEEQNE